MTPELWERITDRLGEFLSLGPEARADRLLALEREDAAVAAEVRRLLAHHDQANAEGFLQPAGSSTGVERPFAQTEEEQGDVNQGPSRFRRLRPHARGGLGEVFVARDLELEREVALKEIQEQYADQPDHRARFLVEAEITGHLEHPGIVPVYGLGTHDDGRPYYAMRLIQGESLETAIAAHHQAGASALSLRDLLGRFLGVCDAVAYAHSRGVVHRDLKPRNIMLGPFGETLVVDWGLAKVVGTTERDVLAQAAIAPPSADARPSTLAGSVLGTPSYMAPEQASGESAAVGPWSDVFSLGATLWHLITGRAPGRPLVAPPGVPRALEAVARKAMAGRPADRYGSPTDLANDIKHWLADEPVSAHAEPWSAAARRWLRRHRVLTTSAAAGVLVGLVASLTAAILVSAKNQALALAIADRDRKNEQLDAQRRRAERNVDAAIASLRKLRDIIVVEPRLKDAPTLRPLREALLKEALASFQTLKEDIETNGDTGPAALAKLATAAFDLGKTYSEIDDKRQAVTAFQQAREIRERLAREAPNGADHMRDLAATHHNLAYAQRDTGDVAGAIESLRAGEAVCAAMPPELQAQPEVERDRARTRNSLALLLFQQGKVDEARSWYDQALEVRERLARDHPDDPRFANELANSFLVMGSWKQARKETAAAHALYVKAREVLEPVTRAHPDVEAYQSDLATCLNELATLECQSGRHEAALTLYEKTREVLEGLLHKGPTNPKYHRDVAVCVRNLAAEHHDLGRRDEALALSEEALKTAQRLTAEFPGDVELQRDVVNGLFNLGVLRRKYGQLTPAREALEKARAEAEAYAKRWPDDPEGPIMRERCRRAIANLERAESQKASAP